MPLSLPVLPDLLTAEWQLSLAQAVEMMELGMDVQQQSF
jgi:hypothetical protein